MTPGIGEESSHSKSLNTGKGPALTVALSLTMPKPALKGHGRSVRSTINGISLRTKLLFRIKSWPNPSSISRLSETGGTDMILMPLGMSLTSGIQLTKSRKRGRSSIYKISSKRRLRRLPRVKLMILSMTVTVVLIMMILILRKTQTSERTLKMIPEREPSPESLESERTLLSIFVTLIRILQLTVGNQGQ